MQTRDMYSLTKKDHEKLDEIIDDLDAEKINNELGEDRFSSDLPPYNLINSQAFLDTKFPNPCWFNSILYVLFNLKEFVSLFSHYSIYDKSELANQIYYMMKQYQYAGNKKISTYHLYLYLKTYHNHDLYDGEFQSAPEFFQFLMTDLVSELDKKTEHGERLFNMFRIDTGGSDYCCNCRQQVFYYYAYTDCLLRIGVPDFEHNGKKSTTTLYDCFYRNFYYPNGSVRKSNVSCEHCGDRKIYSMSSFPNDIHPPVLVITFERGFITEQNKKHKDVTVNYPYVLNYYRINNKCRNKNGDNIIPYMLKAVVIHEEVHYYSYVRAYNDQKWYIMDGDYEIRKLSLNEFNKKVMNNTKASMLFYELIDQDLLYYDKTPNVVSDYPDFNTDDKLFKEYMEKQKGKVREKIYIE